jgi:hypothetical protein
MKNRTALALTNITAKCRGTLAQAARKADASGKGAI